MKIDSTLSTGSTPVNSRPPARPSAEAAPSGEAVNLSALAGALKGGEKPPVNSARIQEIKEAISQGKFKINPEAIANGLIETARELVNSQRKA
ncbi:MAG: flagellar biosynthesis anti-sigma factor FlgM [Bacteroidota bacterium]